MLCTYTYIMVYNDILQSRTWRWVVIRGFVIYKYYYILVGFMKTWQVYYATVNKTSNDWLVAQNSERNEKKKILKSMYIILIGAWTFFVQCLFSAYFSFNVQTHIF